MKKIILIILFPTLIFSQNIDVNDNFINSKIRTLRLLGKLETNLSLNIKPLNSNNLPDSLKSNEKVIFVNKKENIKFKTLGIDYTIDFNSHHPYNRNNGTMIPNKGYQHLFSPGFFFEIGPLQIQLKPEHHYSDNLKFDGFWEGHYPVIWAKRYRLWNHIDMPERHGSIRHNKLTLGQSSIRFNWKNYSIGISNENIWWGPSIRNSIMMSNHARGFKHITLNSIRPISTIFGNLEFQIITGRLESSGYNPPRTDLEYAGTKLFVPKWNQNGKFDDWRYLQGFIFSYSPSFIDNLSIGMIRWAQMYSALVKGKYTWMSGKPTYFPAFLNIFRNNDRFVDFEQQTNQAISLFFKWFWEESNSEIYAEFAHNDSKQNLRDLFLDSDHSRAVTIGLQKIFKIKNNNFLFSWEWTQMEQNASRLIRNAGSWYEHGYVYDGFTNYGEVLGSSIGPGSNSHYFSINRIKDYEKIGFAIEVIDHDNDFFHEAFAKARDFRRYWKDINIHLNLDKEFKNFKISSNLVYIRSLNYQWELDDFATPYYHPGRDVNNFHLSLKLTYFGNW